MFDLDRWQEIWQTITRNKLRSFMTAFGFLGNIYARYYAGIGQSPEKWRL